MMIEQVVKFSRALDELKQEVFSAASENGDEFEYDLNYHLIIREKAQTVAKRWGVPYYELYEGLIIHMLSERRASGKILQEVNAAKLAKLISVLRHISVQDYEDEEPANMRWLALRKDAHTLAKALGRCAASARGALKDIGEE